ncbi:outer membrane beta-barrel protein [Reichenbachiella sp. MALMAid0571]|uniref:outer membrane protein n=1 Tax=Reichenbachiella sp. MALMAid0571 TaxID=3143939 RepID=UPI0032DF4AB8
MKKAILMVFFMATTAIATAQNLYVESGKSTTSFDYKNSQGTSLENLQATNQSFMAIGCQNQLFIAKLQAYAGLHYASYGAIGSDPAIGSFMEWEVNYAGIDVGFDYDVVDIKKASVYLKGGLSAAHFIQGTQNLNNSVSDLKNNDDFDTNLITLQIGVGVAYPISNHLSLYTQYLYGKSFDMIKGDESLKIKSTSISFGLLIDISKEGIKETKKRK